jgi:hypothetical protein
MSNLAASSYVYLQHDVCRISLQPLILRQSFYLNSCLLFVCVRTLANIYFKRLLISNRLNNKEWQIITKKVQTRDNNFTKRQGGNVSWCFILSASLRQRQVAVMHRDKKFFNFLSTITYGLHADNNNGTADCHEYLEPMDSTKYPRGVSV